MEFYTAIIKKSGDQYVALCLELGVAGSGYTPDEAKETLKNAIESYVDYAKETDLQLDRPISVKELHEFLEYGEEPSKLRKEKIRILTYV